MRFTWIRYEIWEETMNQNMKENVRSSKYSIWFIIPKDSYAKNKIKKNTNDYNSENLQIIEDSNG
jgi:hypothetical protein